jgi:competence protein ComEA
MLKIRNFISHYFSLSKKESNGLLVLFGIMLLIIFSPIVYRVFFIKQLLVLDSDKKTLDSLVLLLEQNQLKDPSNKESVRPGFSQIKTYLYFNPNTASEGELIQAGVPKFLAQRILKFRAKGGTFKIKGDLKKMYGLSATKYDQLYPFIELPEKIEKSTLSYKPITKEKEIKPLLDINKVDSAALTSIKGIGPVLSIRILKYRNKLGGFIFKKQLTEVYGLDSLILEEILKYIFVDENFKPKKINLNNSDSKPLFSHPYIGYKTASVIIQYRKQHGRFNSPDQLKNIKIMNEEQYSKMLPYLTAE